MVNGYQFTHALSLTLYRTTPLCFFKVNMLIQTPTNPQTRKYYGRNVTNVYNTVNVPIPMNYRCY
jgi:hypothetical protein